MFTIYSIFTKREKAIDLVSAKSLESTKSSAFTYGLVINQYLIDENLSNMTEMSS